MVDGARDVSRCIEGYGAKHSVISLVWRSMKFIVAWWHVPRGIVRTEGVVYS